MQSQHRDNFYMVHPIEDEKHVVHMKSHSISWRSLQYITRGGIKIFHFMYRKNNDETEMTTCMQVKILFLIAIF